jgi:3-methyladenine DNA glycosylase AlkD
MNKTQTMKALEAAGSQTTRKTYLRHGACEPLFGVRYADLYKLVKQIGTDHALAEQLWKTGNHDAMVLATMIADPAQMKATTLDQWVKAVKSQPMLDAIAGLVTKTKHAMRCFAKWIDSKQEWTTATGWHVLMGGCCGRPGEPASEIAEQEDAFYEAHLKRIEAEIHDSPNRVRHSMNGALIGIGCRGGSLMKQALAAAKRIGKLEVDHGDTSCKTPDAAAYIRKTVEHQKKKKKKKTAKRQTVKA